MTDLTPVQRRLAFSFALVISALGIAFHRREQKKEVEEHLRAVNAPLGGLHPSPDCGRCQHRSLGAHAEACNIEEADDGLILICDECMGMERTRGAFARHLRDCGRPHVERYAVPQMAFNLMETFDLRECRHCRRWRSAWRTPLRVHEILCERARALESKLLFPALPPVERWRLDEAGDLIPPPTLRWRIQQAEEDLAHLDEFPPTMAMREDLWDEDERRLHEHQVARDQYHIRSRRRREEALLAQGVYVDPLDVPTKRQGRCGHGRKRKAPWATEAPEARQPRRESPPLITPEQLRHALVPPTLPMSATEEVARHGLVMPYPSAEQRDIRHQDGFLQVTVQLTPTTAASTAPAALPSSATLPQRVPGTRTGQAYERSTGDRVASVTLWGTLPVGPGVAMYVDGRRTGERAADVYYEAGVSASPPANSTAVYATTEVHVQVRERRVRQVGTLWATADLPREGTFALVVGAQTAIIRFSPVTQMVTRSDFGQ